MEPEIRDAIDRLSRLRNGETYRSVYGKLLRLSEMPKADDEGIIANYFIAQHTAEPVEWPTEPGAWWMQTNDSGEPLLVGAYGSYVVVNQRRTYRESLSGARFLRANIPTFPPREPSLGEKP